MEQVILLRYGEIFLKGKNRSFFESTLVKNIKSSVAQFGAEVSKSAGRIYVTNLSNNIEQIIERLQKVFGLVSLSVATQIDTSISNIEELCKTIKIKTSTFKVITKRADKKFPIQSDKFSAMMGGVILDNNSNVSVDVVNPQTIVNIDIRENGKTFIYYEKISCAGGLPLGTAGKGLLLLSGGIDSPVAGYMMAKRGLAFDCIHFHSFPYTSQQAKDKVISLAHKLTPYVHNHNLFVVPFTKIQENIHKYCDDDYMVILVRRFMMKIAERVAQKYNLQALITGENLAQVASQTIQSITVTNQAVENIPVFRPLIAFDKIEIMGIAKNIGTYETSILPYEDCCSVFLPNSPVTKHKLDKILKNESKLNVDSLIDEAINNIEIINIK